MNTKECYILDGSKNLVFYGTLNLDLIENDGYNFYEVSESLKDRALKIENGVVVIDHQSEYDNAINYQKKCFKEFRDESLLQISYAKELGNTSTANALNSALNQELSDFETRVNNIIKGS